MFQTLGDKVKAKEYYEKSLTMALKIGERKSSMENWGSEDRRISVEIKRTQKPRTDA